MLKTRRQCALTVGACVAAWVVLGLLVAFTPQTFSDPFSPIAGALDVVAFVLLVAAAVQWVRLRGARATAPGPARR